MLNGQLSQKCVGDPIHYFVLCKFCLTEKLLIIRPYIYIYIYIYINYVYYIFIHALLIYIHLHIYMLIYICSYRSWVQIPLRQTLYSYFKESFSDEYHLYQLIKLHSCDYLNKNSMKTKVATDEGNSRNEM